MRARKIIRPSTQHASAEPLFRPEVVREQQGRWLGTVLIEPKLPSWFMTGFSVAATAAVVAFLMLGTYTRKATVTGWLVPDQGLIRIVAPHAATVQEIHVAEGTMVERGRPLLALSTEVHTEALGATRAEITRRLAARRDSLIRDRATQERMFVQKNADLQQRLQVIAREQGHLRKELELLRARLSVSGQALEREQVMRMRDLIPLTRLHRAEQEHFDQQARIQGLERSQAALDREEALLRGSLWELPMLRETAIADVERQTVTLEQELAEAEARRQIVITAPQAGTVTAIQTEPGGSASPSATLMSIVPAGSRLQAHLFSPSRAIGFVRSGQQVLIRHRAFPYQKFGSQRGVVVAVSLSAISTNDLPQYLTAQQASQGAAEPIYRVTVDIDRQAIQAYGHDRLLQPGMQIDADIILERRRLIEWVFEPIYSITGKLGG